MKTAVREGDQATHCVLIQSNCECPPLYTLLLLRSSSIFILSDRCCLEWSLKFLYDSVKSRVTYCR